MDRVTFPYPPSPQCVPDDLTRPSSDYKTRVVLVLISLICFFGLYLLLTTGSLAIVVLSLLYVPMPWAIVPIVLFGLIFLFLLKGFFKQHEKEKSLRVEITEEEHPKLYAFIERLCDETNAPFPHRIFVTPEVNAAVFYNDAVTSLVLPTPKNLLIGLGLVNVLNLSEFKAVLAHEFGHFSQNSMKLTNYVYVANMIISDLVFGRDWFDQMIDSVCSADVRLAIFGWPIYGVLWLFRKVLEGIYYGINFLTFALSRQMEFNADLVAVSVAGSDAIVHSLARLDFANDCLSQAYEDLRTAADHQLYTCDLFYHQNHAASFLRKVRKDPKLGEPPPLPDDPHVCVEIFEPSDDHAPQMWSTHPSNYDREQNIKDCYIRSVIDKRSPWLLFDDAAELREKVTWKFYRVVAGLKKDVVLADPAGVQEFIDAEHAETTYDARYHGLYDDRYIEPGKLSERKEEARQTPWKADKIARVHRNLYAGDLEKMMKDHVERRQEIALLSGLERGELELKNGEFDFRGKTYGRGDVRRLLKKLDRELEDDRAWMADIDRKVFLCHYQMARELGNSYLKEFLQRYEFHLGVQKISRDLAEQQNEVETALVFLSNANTQLEHHQFQEILGIFREAHAVLSKSLRKADAMTLPELRNLTKGEPLGQFLLDAKLVKEFRPYQRTLTGKWISKFLSQLSGVRDKVRRIHFKSLGGLLALQEKIAHKWTKELATLPEVEAVEEEPQRPARSRHWKAE